MVITDISIPLKYVFTQATEPDDKTEGKLWYNTSDNSLYTSNGTDYVKLGIDTTFFNEIFNNSLDILDIQAQETLEGGQSAYMIRDLFTDADGYLDTIDTGNTTANFDTNLYYNLKLNNPSLIFEDTSQVEALTTGYVTHKTFDNLYCLVKDNEITNQLMRSDDGSGRTAKCRLRYTYFDDTTSYSNECVYMTNTKNVWADFSYTNPNQNKIVIKVEVQIARGNYSHTIYERNTSFTGSTVEYTDLIIQSNKQDLNIEPSNFQVYAHKSSISGTGSITASVSFDNGANYQTVNLNTTTPITNKGDEMILKLNLNAGASNGVASCGGYGVMFW